MTRSIIVAALIAALTFVPTPPAADPGEGDR
jgi:hypothetical protein